MVTIELKTYEGTNKTITLNSNDFVDAIGAVRRKKLEEFCSTVFVDHLESIIYTDRIERGMT